MGSEAAGTPPPCYHLGTMTEAGNQQGTTPERPTAAVDSHPFVLESFDGEQLAGYHWRTAPEERAPRGVLLMLHGYAEHAGRHERLAAAAAEAGFHVWSFDQRNHGNSPGAVRGSVDGYEPALADLAALQAHARERSGALPTFLFGHSMGGAIALRYALEHPERLDGLVLSAPFLVDAAKRPALVSAAAPLLGNLFPSLATMRIPATTISRDPSEVARYEADPLIYRGGVRANAGATMLEQGATLSRLASNLAVSTLVVHGSADQVADVAGSRQLAAASKNVRFVEQEGGFHELHHDAADSGVPSATRAIILEWLEARAAAF